MKKIFKTCRAYWHFQQEVLRSNRYIRSADAEDFLETILSTSESPLRHTTMPRGEPLWRAQLGHDMEEWDDIVGDIPCPFPAKRMLPLPDSSTEGRANPKGIPYLYLATNRDTALAEVRPWIGSLISVGEFKTLRDLRLVNCVSHKKNTCVHTKEPTPAKMEVAVWADINQAFSTPVTLNDKGADYAPTQIITELFKNAGFDGVVFKSALEEDGINVTLFNMNSVKLLNRSLYEAKSIKFEFTQTAAQCGA